MMVALIDHLGGAPSVAPPTAPRAAKKSTDTAKAITRIKTSRFELQLRLQNFAARFPNRQAECGRSQSADCFGRCWIKRLCPGKGRVASENLCTGHDPL